MEFLIASAVSHPAFDVYRLRDASRINQRNLVQEAKRIAIPDNGFGFAYVCSSAVAAVLSKVTGNRSITARTPDDFKRGFFVRHPQLSGKSINIEAALNEHDKLLRNTVIDLTVRSCANPGSVTQAEMDSLSAPYRKGFAFDVDPGNPEVSTYPRVVGSCLDVYSYIAEWAGKRPDAENVTRLATPSPPVEPIAAQPTRPIEAARPVPPSPFLIALPQLKEFAIAACRAPASASPVFLDLNDAFYAGLYGRGGEIDQGIRYYELGLDGCPRKLFYQLIAMVLDGGYWKVGTRDWIPNTVASYSRANDVSPVYTDPPPRTGGGGGAPRPSPAPPVVRDPEGEALRQLRRVEDAAMRQRWGLPPR